MPNQLADLLRRMYKDSRRVSGKNPGRGLLSCTVQWDMPMLAGGAESLMVSNCDAVGSWTTNANNTLSQELTDKKEGTASLKCYTDTKNIANLNCFKHTSLGVRSPICGLITGILSFDYKIPAQAGLYALCIRFGNDISNYWYWKRDATAFDASTWYHLQRVPNSTLYMGSGGYTAVGVTGSPSILSPLNYFELYWEDSSSGGFSVGQVNYLDSIQLTLSNYAVDVR